MPRAQPQYILQDMCEKGHLAMCQQPRRIIQKLLLLCCPCQAGAQLMHHLCGGQGYTSSHLLRHIIA